MAEKKAEYNFLGKSGVRVSNICLGTMTFGRREGGRPMPVTQSSEELAHEIMDKYVELGGNFLDTANVYQMGRSEEIVGTWLAKQDRSRLIIATKVRGLMDATEVNSVGLSRRHIVDSCERSLERLQTSYIDLYQSHLWDSATPIEETLRTFDDLIRAGKVRYFGCSNVVGWQMQTIIDRCVMMGINKCVSLQQQYNLLSRQSEYEEFMVCRNEGIGVLPWSPLKGGLLTGKYKRDEKPDPSSGRIGFIHQDEKIAIQSAPAWSQFVDDEAYWQLMDTLSSIAKYHGKTIPQVAIRWLLQKDIVSSVLVGATSVKQLEDNMGAGTGWKLSDEEGGRPMPPNQATEELSHQIMDKFAELGGNFLDTANVYQTGISEQIVGNWLSKQERSRFVIATKVRFNMDATNVNKVGLSRRHIVESCEESLERLKTNYIDLYQSHCWDNATPLDETLRTFDDLIRCGKIRYYGPSNVCGWQLQKIVDKLEMMGLNRCVSLQQQYNLLCRQPEFEEFMVCQNEGIGVLPWSPLKGGLLTGKYKKEEKPSAESGRIGFVHQDERMAMQAAPAWSQFVDDDGFWKLMDTMSSVAKNHGKTVPQVALRWLIQKDVVSSVIIGATSLKQLEDNMGASSGWEISKEEMDSLDQVAPRSEPYPYDVLWKANADRFNYFNKSSVP